MACWQTHNAKRVPHATMRSHRRVSLRPPCTLPGPHGCFDEAVLRRRFNTYSRLNAALPLLPTHGVVCQGGWQSDAQCRLEWKLLSHARPSTSFPLPPPPPRQKRPCTDEWRFASALIKS